MPTVPRPHARRLRAALLAAACGVVCAATAPAADVVIMPDGFVIQGRHFKEKEIVSDPARGSVRVDKATGFDVIDAGPKFVIFSRHALKGGKLEADAVRADPLVFKTKFAYYGGRPGPLPAVQSMEYGKFNEHWKREIVCKVVPDAKTPGKAEAHIGQQVVSLDPNTMDLASWNYAWKCSYHTSEQDPNLILYLLSVHPDLKDPPGKVDPHRRLSIAAFMKEVGWLRQARAELERLKKDAPPPWDKETTERYDRLLEDVEKAEAKVIIDELDAAVASGRYRFAQRIVQGYAPKVADPKELTRLGNLKAQVEEVQPRYAEAVRLLRGVIDQEGGLRGATVFAGLGGGPGLVWGPRPKPDPDRDQLLFAAAAVLAELHPDTTPRIEFFIGQASQAERWAREGKEPADTPAQLLALAVTGWLKGKNGADKSVPAAVRCWATRQMALAYLREDIGNKRHKLLDDYLKSSKPLGPEELAQIITLLPPPLAEDLKKPAGRKVSVAEAGVDGVYLRTTGPTPALPKGADYFLRLPPEYHHGRSYPLVIVLGSPELPGERLIGLLAEQADRYGYVLASPAWTNQFVNKPYDFSGDQHPLVTATLRDVQRRFQVDPDRVFLYGFNEGANFALDVGLAKPDLFAGVNLICPNPPPHIFGVYWHNAQKLPFYTVTGELSGVFPNIRKIYEKWMGYGFPGLLTEYKGRQVEVFASELPRMFDWMGRKTRARGAASLRLGQTGFEPWQVLRETDDRFYWIGSRGLRLGNPLAGWQNKPVVNVAAQFRADLGKNNAVTITECRGVRKLVIWLERDLIDWSKPLPIYVNGDPRKPVKLEPDLHVLFEELYRSGDKKMLFFGKVEIDGAG